MLEFPVLTAAGSAFLVTAPAEAVVTVEPEEDAVEREVPDLVVCDVIMPHVDGREFVRRIRGRQLWLPILLLTQVGESWERSAALDEGADDYLNKPFDPHELISRIRAGLRRSSSP